MTKEKRTMTIYDLTIADYKAILEAMKNLGIDVKVEVIDQNGFNVYSRFVTRPKHIKGEK